MEAFAKSLTFLGSEQIIEIPFFQRPYVWDEENWKDLLEDLSSIEKGHFLGSIIIKQAEGVTGEPKKALLIDGQQRLTTLSILLKAIYDLFDDETKNNTENALRNILFYKKKSSDRNWNIKIKHSHVDAPNFNKIINVDLERVNVKDDEKHLIVNCYRYFYQNLSLLGREKLVDMFDFLMNDNSRILVVIDLKLDDDEQSIFDTINSAGVRLSSADIIKNNLFQRLIQLSRPGDNDVIQFYGETWKKTFIEDDDTVDFWDEPRPTGRIMRDNIEILLHSIAVIKKFYDPEKHNLSDLANVYKLKIASIQSEDELKEFIKSIMEYANIYKEHLQKIEKNTVLSYENDLLRLLHILDSLQISTFHPLLLSALQAYGNDSVQLINITKKLEIYVVRNLLSGRSTKNYNKECIDFINDPVLLDSKIAEISDVEIKPGLKNINNKNASLILFWIELYDRYLTRNTGDIYELKYSYSLEHIMPQKWQTHWSNIPVKFNTDGSQMSPESAKLDRQRKIYWLGNMTLLKSSLNSSLKNYEFTRKINGEKRKKGIKAYADLRITKKDLVDPFENTNNPVTHWDEERIKERTDRFFNKILEIWPGM